MRRKITEQTTQAFKDGTPLTVTNTKVMGDKNHTIMTLFDNVIATIERDGDDGDCYCTEWEPEYLTNEEI